ncbi:hypothetical protein Q9S36_39510 [Microbacterium sp. ARD31]|uniref:hypothetical protein n=1 Tax=Microbacterium sp. ARD31 TaxID=2962576 RepID=UPI002880DA0E|nr:hypothetical protein [Microbacterium sp. ARD31]MDT0186294.1 hypothetical protein [Microbacterium sp. ARD31]
MILAGLTLLTIGGLDLVRAFLARRWAGYVVVGAATVALGIAAGAIIETAVALLAASAWIWSVPSDRRVRAGFWPALGIGVLCALAVMSIPPREQTGPIGDVWRFPTPAGELSFDAAVLVCGAVVFLMESANVIVRIALNSERAAPGDPSGVTVAVSTSPSSAGEEPAEPQPLDERPALKGGRLIGPLERILVFALTLLSAYTLVAAFLAAKGIVRFPEISRDSAHGDSAEYFLIGSMVSWVVALSAAALVWWSLSIG